MKMTKKLTAIVLCFVVIMVMGVPTFATEISVLINGEPIASDQPPVNQDGRTLVPLRAIFVALGASIDWNSDTQTVTVVTEDVTVIMQIGNNVFTRNGERITLDVPPQIVGSRTLVPIRAVAESFGADVDWEQSTQTVVISTTGGSITTSLTAADDISVRATEISALLQAGINITLLEAALGVAPQKITEAYDGRPAYRFDLMTVADYVNPILHDGDIDWEGLRDGLVRIIVHVTYDTNDYLTRHSIYYSPAENRIYHIGSDGVHINASDILEMLF